MNYIKQLQTKLDDSNTIKEDTKKLIIEFRKHLTSTKYHCGNELDNYICVTDVHNWLDTIANSLYRDIVE